MGRARNDKRGRAASRSGEEVGLCPDRWLRRAVMTGRVRLLGWAMAAAFAVPAAGQQVGVTTTDGAVVVGKLTGIAGKGREANLQLVVGDQHRTVSLARVLAVHGPAPIPVGGAVVYLVGGDQLRGELRGGDTAGETFTVQSRSLGEMSVPIDRLRAVVLPDGRGAGPGAFEIPAEVGPDEALFRRAREGYDTILGAIHRFTSRGVLFEWAEESVPDLFRYDRLAAIALRGGAVRQEPASAQLITRTGDVMSVDLLDVRDDRFVFRVEGERELSLGVADLSALTFFGDDRRYLSDLEPEAVEERGTSFEQAAPLYPFRRDRAASGGFLVADGFTHGKGLGTHSRSVLKFRVPEGFRAFHARVGIDDGVLQTSVRGSASVSVMVGDKVVFGPEIVRGGERPRDLGSVPVDAGQLLTLQVEFGEGWFLGDRVDWLTAVLIR